MKNLKNKINPLFIAFTIIAVVIWGAIFHIFVNNNICVSELTPEGKTLIMGEQVRKKWTIEKRALLM